VFKHRGNANETEMYFDVPLMLKVQKKLKLEAQFMKNSVQW
jgi:hypothetical protein